MPEEDPIRWAEEALAGFNDHDLDAFIARYAEDAVHHQPDRPEPLRGREANRRDYEARTFRPFPDARFEAERMFGCGDMVCVQGVLTGTHLGPLEGTDGTLPPTGRRIRVPLCMVARIRDGLAVEVWEYNDQLGFLRQLESSGESAEPPPP